MLPHSGRAALRWLALSIGVFGCSRHETVETFRDGKPKLVREYSGFGPKDSLHVTRITSFFFNGKMEYDERMRHGRREGEYKAYWSNGQIESEGRFADGLREGPWEFHYNRFTLSAKGSYVHDSAEGEWIQYWENGEMKQRGAFHHGGEIGEWVGWNKRGGEALRNSCFAANPTGHYRSFHDNGEVKEDYACRQGVKVGAYVEKDPDGKPVRLGLYDSTGAKDSLWTAFHGNGIPASREHFLKGLWNDSVLFWDSLGRVTQRGFFRAGTGLLTKYDSIGRIVETQPMLEGHEEGEHWKYFPDGKKKLVMRFHQDQPVSYQRWHANGVVAATGEFLNGKRTGVWKEWDDRKTLRESSIYVNGMLHGERRFFDTTGTLTRSQKYFHGIPSEGAFPGIPGGVKVPRSHSPVGSDSSGPG